MKKFIIIFLSLLPIFQSCVANAQTGEMEPGWLFWVFLGLLLGGVFIGFLVNALRKKKLDGTLSKSEEEIEAYEATLEKKLEEEKSKEEDKQK